MRYQSWWYTDFKKEFEKYFEVIVLGEKYINSSNLIYNSKNFSIFDKAIEFEQYQISEFLNMKIYNDDILFLADLSFPGFFTNVLYHKPIKNCYVFCHGTSKNNYDYFQKNRQSKWLIEKGHSKLFKKVFVATNYHKNKLGWNNIDVIGVPKPSFKIQVDYNKINNIISVSRDDIQKRNKTIEYQINKFETIKRSSEYDNWGDYYQFIANSKILLITSKEDTFGYSVMDAIENKCIPIAPNKLSFPELLPQKYLYNNIDELSNIIHKYLNFNMSDVPVLLNQNLIYNFYDNLIHRMISG
jgi:hypothetical protein